ncbi:vacuolar assembly protein DID2 [Neoconidiobolus thromboides FSU 785]|nr:vacuolar assembly protein DID2 [Neoconidiobolus thromboides FSU 785]
MSNLENSLFQLKFTAKSLNRQSAKALQEEKKQKTKLKKALQSGNIEGARIHASDAIRKKNESINLQQLASRIDAVSSRVQTAVTMRRVTNSMGSVVKGMDRAMESMNLEKISAVMEKFESQFEDLDVQTATMEASMGGATALTTPQDDVEALIQQVADENGLELEADLANAPNAMPSLANRNSTKVGVPVGAGGFQDDDLTARLAKLRNP